MLALALALVAGNPGPQEFKIEPSDDVWVYQFAEAPDGDPYLRVWGSDEGAVGKSFEGHLAFSYSCLKFETPSEMPKSAPTSAELVLTHTPEAGWAGTDSKAHPVEARSLTTDWNEKTWANENALKVHPSADAATIFGTGWAEPRADDKSFEIHINLLEKPDVFAKALAASQGTLALAVTSSMTPAQSGENTVYKFYSRNNDANLRPKLVIKFAEGSLRAR